MKLKSEKEILSKIVELEALNNTETVRWKKFVRSQNINTLKWVLTMKDFKEV